MAKDSEVLNSHDYWKRHGGFVDPQGNSYVFRVSESADSRGKGKYELKLYSCGLNGRDENGIGDDIKWSLSQ